MDWYARIRVSLISISPAQEIPHWHTQGSFPRSCSGNYLHTHKLAALLFEGPQYL